MNVITVDDLVRWRNVFEKNRARYADAKPFPFVVIDNFLDDVDARQVAETFPTVNKKTWTNYIHFNEKKYGLNKKEAMPTPLLGIINKLNSIEFLENLTLLTGIPGLMADDTLEGGGLHQTERGGFLNIHSDFLIHPVRINLMRRINLILFLSTDWKEKYGGHLEFWNKDMTRRVQRIVPVFNRCVIFNTDEFSYHGCPDPVNCPQDMSRKTLALYYYREYSSLPGKLHTQYKARPEDRHKRVGIYLDNKAVALYSWMKRKFKFTDRVISQILRRMKL